jgi:putative ABC transport system permease protein
VTRLYRILLRAYPRWFRARYGAELLAAFAGERRDPRHAGISGAIRFWRHIGVDLALTALRLRLARAPATTETVHSRRRAMETLLQDLRHACRALARRPGFVAVAVLSLALGIGGNAMIFGLVDGLVLNPFPYPDADRVVGIGVTFPRVSDEESFIETLSPAEFREIRESRSIRDIAAFDLGNRNISGGDRPERVFTGFALTDPFGPFGVRPALGRGFTTEELQPNGPSVAILSYRLWQSRFGGDVTLVGRDIRVNGASTTVVGIMPPELLILGADLWIPWGGDPLSLPRNVRQFTLIGRLAPGATIDQANAELSSLAAAVAQAHAGQFKEYEGWRIAAAPWHHAVMRDARPAAFLLLGAVGLVLLIACANLSNLLLARSTTRQREIAVRLALGAARYRIARHLLAEVGVLSAAGAALGLVVAHAGLRAASTLVPRQLESMGLTASVNGRVLAWTALFTIGAALLVALLPVLQGTRTDPQDILKGDARGATASRAPRRLQHALIVAEIALSVMLLAGAGLLMRSFVRLRDVDPGIDARNVLTMRLTLPREKYSGEGGNEFFQQLVDRLADAPGVQSASVASQFPPDGPFTGQFRLLGRETPGTTVPSAMMTVASAGHFELLDVPIVAGRTFTARDRSNTPAVAVVNRTFASRFLPGVDPVGRRLSLGSPDRPQGEVEIVGVAADTRNQGVTRPTAPEVFIPLHQQAVNNQLFLMVRAERDAAEMLGTIRREIAAIDPEQPIYAIRTLGEAFSAATFQQRLSTILLGLFAAVAVSLAGIGIYGVMSYSVSARTQEIGVRMAVGAGRRDVLWLVLGQVLRLTALGLAIGVALVVAAGGALRRVLFEVQPTDPATIAAVAVVLGSVALVAGWLPAWHASRVDPLDALRYE